MKLLFLFLFLIPRAAICQVEPFKDEEYYSKQIEKNIFRGTLTFLVPPEFNASICYEHELIKPFTLVLKAGSSVFTHDISSDSEIQLALRASGELRYYFNLKKRIKKDKPTRNFSASYFSLEPFVKSKSLVLYNDGGYEERKSTTGVYLNIGIQGQVKRDYIAAFFGIRFGAKEDTGDELFDFIHAGFVIGRVF